MPPKAKEAVKKPPPPIVRPPISDSSLVYIPSNAIEGFEERINTGIDWTLEERALRYHRKQVRDRGSVPSVTFSQALENKLKKSVLDGFLRENTSIPLEQQWELILATTLWDNEKFASGEGKICFESANCLTNDVFKLIKKAVLLRDRQVLWDNMKMVEVMRVTGVKMTELDSSVLDFNRLVSFNLCGNYLMDIDAHFIPPTVRSLELQSNLLSGVESFAEFLPPDMLYLGLSKNLLSSDNVGGLALLPYNLSVLDISDNNISDLELVLDALVKLPNLMALYLAGNPCSVCSGYARLTLMRLTGLRWLDARQVLPTDRPLEPADIHPDDLRSTYFHFNVYRIMSIPQPPKADKGAATSFYVELEIPLLDAVRRTFLFFRRNESLTEMLPPPEDEEIDPIQATTSVLVPGAPLPVQTASQMQHSKTVQGKELDETSSHASDVYQHLTAKNPREINNFTIFESNKIQWAKVMSFQEPTVKIFCPDLVALRNTFRTVITIRVVYSVVVAKPGKVDKKSVHLIKQPPEQRVTLATIRCALKNPDWSQPAQHFHWDDSLNTNDAIHWGDGDLSVIQYSQLPAKTPKGKQDTETIVSARQLPPENFTCHFGFGIDTLRTIP